MRNIILENIKNNKEIKEVDITVEDFKLEGDEMLLRIDDGTGFITKLTKKGEIPISFLKYGHTYKEIPGWNLESSGLNRYKKVPTTTFLMNETFRSGWKMCDSRIGLSQQWMVLEHPFGFKLEIYLSNFLEIVKEGLVLKDGLLDGEYKWEGRKLIKKD